MGELRWAKKNGPATGLVGLTFDDGFDDFKYNAVPVLERLGFSATVFVVAGMPGGQNLWEHHTDPKPQLRLLEAADVREVSERGMEVGSHGMMHARLTDLTTEGLRWEVGESRRILEELTGTAVEGFCYPYGILNSKVMHAVRAEGYAYACSIFTRVGSDAYDLPRLDVSSRDTPPVLTAKLLMHSQYLAAKRFYWRYPAIRSAVRKFRTS